MSGAASSAFLQAPLSLSPVQSRVREQAGSAKPDRVQGAVRSLVLNGDAGVNLRPPGVATRKENFRLRSPRGPAARLPGVR